MAPSRGLQIRAAQAFALLGSVILVLSLLPAVFRIDYLSSSGTTAAQDPRIRLLPYALQETIVRMGQLFPFPALLGNTDSRLASPTRACLVGVSTASVFSYTSCVQTVHSTCFRWVLFP